jgi:ABC-type branched-subunit amino acid transport system ATPase component
MARPYRLGALTELSPANKLISRGFLSAAILHRGRNLNIPARRIVPAGFMSRGDKRLLQVAMALAQSRLLLPDEPTQGLSLGEATEGSKPWPPYWRTAVNTVLLVEHDTEVVFRLAEMITVCTRVPGRLNSRLVGK